MSNDNHSSSPPGSPNGSSTGSPEMASDQVNNSEDDQEAMALRNESNIVSITSTNDDGTYIQTGDSEPVASANVPLVANNALFDGQPMEWDAHIAETTVEIMHPPSPTNMNIYEDFEVQLSPGIENATVHGDVTDVITEFGERETLAEFVENENDEGELPVGETVAVETAESPAHHVPIYDELPHFPVGSPVLPELIQDGLQEQVPLVELAVVESPVVNNHNRDNDEEDAHQVQVTTVESPIVIVITQENNNEEEVHQVQPTPDADPTVEINQLENDPPVELVPITERTPPVASPSLEAADQLPIFDTDNSNQTIEHIAHLTVLRGNNKRASSMDEIRPRKNKHTAGGIKRSRRSAS